MTLLPIKGYPYYRVDCENHTCYCVRGGVLRAMKIHPPYREVILFREKEKRVTIPRLEWCALNDVSPDDIPKGYCIRYGDSGRPEVCTRADVVQKAGQTRKMNSAVPKKVLIKTMKAILRNDRRAYELVVVEETERARRYYEDKYHRASLSVDEAIEKATSSAMEKWDNERVVTDIFRFTVKYLHCFFASRRIKRRDYIDNMTPIEL